MSPRAWLVGAFALLGCLPAAEPYRCDRAGGDPACDSVPGGRCVLGYCAEIVPNSLCPSGLRYTESAARARSCVPTDAATSPADIVDATSDLAQLDAPDATALEDRATTAEVTAADLPPPVDITDASAPADVPDVFDAVDAPTPRDVFDVADAPTPRDVFDVVDAPTPRDVFDVVDARDAADVRDGSDALDTPDVRDLSDVPLGSQGVTWISPLPNERYLSRTVTVRVRRRGAERVTVRTALGIACEGAQTATLMTGNSVDLNTGNNYLCVRLEVGDDGSAWVSPWRHIVSMGRNHGNLGDVRWGHWPDFNGDGRADLLMATGTAVRVFHFTAMGSITGGATIPGPSSSARPVSVGAVGDVDGDSYGDAVIAWDLDGRREVHLHRGAPTGLRGPALRVASRDPGSDGDLTFGERIFSLGDRGTDGRANFGVSAFGGAWVRTFSVDETGSLVEGSAYVAGTPITAFVSDADVDGDREPDSAFSTASATYLSLSSQINNVLIPPTADGGAGFGRRLAFGGDLDNDGRSELAVLSPGTGEVVVYSWVNNALAVHGRFELPAGSPAWLAMPGDVNNDLADDLFAFGGTNRVRLFLGGFSSFGEAAISWREPVGVILAGAADTDTRGRVWGGGAASVNPNGFIVYGYNGAMVAPFAVPDTLAGPVVSVAP